VAVQPGGPILAAGFVSREDATNLALVRYRVDTPTTIHAARIVVPYGGRLALTGKATQVDPGAGVGLVAKGCYGSSTRRGAATTERSDGGWSAGVQPGTRAAYRARIAGARSETVSVQVRPRISIGQASGSVTVRVLFGHGLSGEWVALQRWRSEHWVDVQQQELERVGRSSGGVVSGATFRKPVAGRYRAFLAQPNPEACYADAASRAIRR
jgi:hypothetical protein